MYFWRRIFGRRVSQLSFFKDFTWQRQNILETSKNKNSLETSKDKNILETSKNKNILESSKSKRKQVSSKSNEINSQLSPKA